MAINLSIHVLVLLVAVLLAFSFGEHTTLHR
jgi:hypothetical protein